jgi:hypothetical protein
VDMIKRNGGLITVCASVRLRDDIARSFLHALPAWIHTFLGEEAYNLWIKPGYLMDSDEYEFPCDEHGIWTGGWCTRQETLDCSLPSVQIDMSSMMEASHKFNRKVQFTTGMTSLGEQTAGTKASILRRKSARIDHATVAPTSSQSFVVSEMTAATAGGAKYVPSDDETAAGSEMSAITAGGAQYIPSDDEMTSQSPGPPDADDGTADDGSTGAISALTAATAAGAYYQDVEDASAAPSAHASILGNDNASVGDPSVLSAKTAGGAHFRDDDTTHDPDDAEDECSGAMDMEPPGNDDIDELMDDKPATPTKPPFPLPLTTQMLLRWTFPQPLPPIARENIRTLVAHLSLNHLPNSGNPPRHPGSPT